MEINSPDAIADILDNAKTIAVVGLSSDRSRPSYNVGAYMKSHGYRIVPVNPNETEVLGEKVIPASRTFQKKSISLTYSVGANVLPATLKRPFALELGPSGCRKELSTCRLRPGRRQRGFRWSWIAAF